MKTTQYFQHVRKRPDRAMIRDEWISHVLEHAEKTEVQTDRTHTQVGTNR